ncbi:YdcF family protein [Tsukamurella sp. 1534]|uniref:YdcF family protein n=1 Tax=Tsukamurella sp. 1534 TaxID=1151061 RepID=UPI0005953B8B|nr:YdcF family protein [Tsukamurella sp. 1534]
MRRLQKLLWCTVLVTIVVLAAVGGVGYLVFGAAHDDPLRKVDAVIVLGGEHDGREQYGLQIAEAGYARNLVLSDPYGEHDPLMRSLCDRTVGEVAITCEVPVPSTTRGEAMFTQRLADRNGWKSVIVISWGYHLPRAEYIFSNCFAGQTVMRAVPRYYDYGPADWELIYLYQSFGTAKAALQGSCS